MQITQLKTAIPAWVLCLAAAVQANEAQAPEIRVYDCEDRGAYILRLQEGRALLLAEGMSRVLQADTEAAGRSYTDGDLRLQTKRRHLVVQEGEDSRSLCAFSPQATLREIARDQGVEFLAAGFEKSDGRASRDWSLQITPDEALFSWQSDRDQPLRFARSVQGPAEQVFTAADGRELRVRREPRACRMETGAMIEQVVVVEVDGRVYRGCGLPLSEAFGGEGAPSSALAER
jgi:hypothetical protein